jgi:hypothetical protein
MPSLETLQERRAKIDAKIRAIKAREAKENRDTRKKIVLGGAVLKHWRAIASGEMKLDNLIKQLPNRDRKLFDEAEETPNAATIAAMNEPPGEPVTLDQFKAELHALMAEA